LTRSENAFTIGPVRLFCRSVALALKWLGGLLSEREK
jgi:hypothetical protein